MVSIDNYCCWAAIWVSGIDVSNMSKNCWNDGGTEEIGYPRQVCVWLFCAKGAVPFPAIYRALKFVGTRIVFVSIFDVSFIGLLKIDD